MLTYRQVIEVICDDRYGDCIVLSNLRAVSAADRAKFRRGTSRDATRVSLPCMWRKLRCDCVRGEAGFASDYMCRSLSSPSQPLVTVLENSQVIFALAPPLQSALFRNIASHSRQLYIAATLLPAAVGLSDLLSARQSRT
jgi:hypothetical protein